jgi:uncharacterized sulfatase
VSQPNLVFLFSDQQRWDTVGAHSGGRSITPNLDALASVGVRFDRAFSCQPVCGPARACLQTGQCATAVGCHTNGRALPPDATTIAHLLRHAGYQAAYVGKWHLASNDGVEGENFRTRPVPPDRRGGWDDYWLAADVLEFTSHSYDGHMFDGEGNRREFPDGRYRVDATTDFALEFLREKRDPDRPFVLMISWIEPHHQNDRNRFEGPHGSGDRFADIPLPADLAESDAEGDYRQNWADYLGCCASLDENVGRVRRTLEELGIAEETLLLYTSDHGCHFQTRNGEYKRSCHDASLHIPMIVSGPGFTGGRQCEQLVSLLDVPPTLLQAAGVTPPESMRGRPLQALGEGDVDQWREEVFVQISESQIGRAIRTPRWTYSVQAPDWEETFHDQPPSSEVYVEDHLYDNHADPAQLNNRVADPSLSDIRDELRVRLLRRIKQAEGATPEIRPQGDS